MVAEVVGGVGAVVPVEGVGVAGAVGAEEGDPGGVRGGGGGYLRVWGFQGEGDVRALEEIDEEAARHMDLTDWNLV